MKEFADDNFNFDENGRKLSKRVENRKLSKRVENNVGKGEIARKSLYCRHITRGAWAPVSLHRPDISKMAEEVFNNYHSIPAF